MTNIKLLPNQTRDNYIAPLNARQSHDSVHTDKLEYWFLTPSQRRRSYRVDLAIL